MKFEDTGHCGKGQDPSRCRDCRTDKNWRDTIRKSWDVPGDWDEVCPWGITLAELNKLPPELLSPPPRPYPTDQLKPAVQSTLAARPPVWAGPAPPQEVPRQEFPPLAEEIKSLAVCVGRAAKALVTRKKVLAPPKIREERIAICEKCEYFAKDAVRCYKCGCKLFAKVALATEACPESKWLQAKEVAEWQEVLP